MNGKQRKKSLRNTLDKNRCYGLISKKGLKKLQKEGTCGTLSFKAEINGVVHTKTFPLTSGDFESERMMQIAVYGARQVLSAVTLNEFEDSREQWCKFNPKSKMTIILKDRKIVFDNWRYKLVLWLDKQFTNIHQNIMVILGRW